MSENRQIMTICPVCGSKPADRQFDDGRLIISYCGKKECRYELENPPRKQGFGIDCLSGTGMQQPLYEQIIRAVGLPKKEPSSSYGGAWSWDYNEIDPDTWDDIKPKIAHIIQNMYHGGKIRGGYWK